jgi:hypothetical protein
VHLPGLAVEEDYRAPSGIQRSHNLFEIARHDPVKGIAEVKIRPGLKETEELLPGLGAPRDLERQLVGDFFHGLPCYCLHLNAAARSFAQINRGLLGQLDDHNNIAALEHVVGAERLAGAANADSVEKSAIRATKIASDPTLFGERHLGMAAADGTLGENDFKSTHPADA